ncbi:MAG: hypothetical protein M1829_006006 [Trizodia sp. TS-e1964]|nr:MAG: hypothetical protein M1829_006006 [Trizodia sp. TS-e1964]
MKRLALVPLLALFAASPVVGESSSCGGCDSIALSSANCATVGYDYQCSCTNTIYSSVLSSCMNTLKDYGCVSSDWSYSSSSISASCAYWTRSMGSSLCSVCETAPIATLNCIDSNDYSCLCGQPNSSKYVALFSTCAASSNSFGAKCPVASMTSIVKYFDSSCSSAATVTTTAPGCPACQAIAADVVSCNGRYDFGCLCTKDYVAALSRCIDKGSCYSSDLTIARNSYVSACSVVSTGGTPTFTSDAAIKTGGANVAKTGTYTTGSVASETAGSTGGSGGKPASQSGDSAGTTSSGPSKPLIYGVAIGVTVAILVLGISVFCLVRKRSQKAASAKQDPVALVAIPSSKDDDKEAFVAPPAPRLHEAGGDPMAGKGYPELGGQGLQQQQQQQSAWQAKGYSSHEHSPTSLYKAPGAYAELNDDSRPPTAYEAPASQGWGYRPPGAHEAPGSQGWGQAPVYPQYAELGDGRR